MVSLKTKKIDVNDMNSYVGVETEVEDANVSEYVTLFLHIANILKSDFNKNKDDIINIIKKFM
jgi:hypothetical protein